jgi:dolichol-phosphate mannosyltransferase
MQINHNRMDLSIIIPALNESYNLSLILPQIRLVLDDLNLNYEIIVVDERADEQTRGVVKENSSKLLVPPNKGYGTAIQAGIEYACGQYLITMDADLSHPPDILKSLWEARTTSDIVIASRYVKGGRAVMPLPRLVLSKILNLIFSRGLDLHIKDMSSGYRLYKSSIVKNQKAESSDFSILQEYLVSAMIDGYSVREIPFTYQPRVHGSSHARILKFGIKYIQTFSKLWRKRNSIASADYDARASETLMLPQRYWQLQRFKHIRKLIPRDSKCLDVGCGSSKIISVLPPGSIALDILMRKLRYSRRYNKILLNGSAMALPIGTGVIQCVICSEVIEHIPRGSILSELDRVLHPGGLLVLGTPDYSKWEWVYIEKLYKLILPQAYADEHVTHYTYKELIGEYVGKRGYILESENYIMQSELIIALRKPHAELGIEKAEL